MSRVGFACLALALGCASPPPRELPATHPASPAALEAPAPPASGTLAVDADDAAAAPAPEPAHHAH